jgi:hypothetical protein
VLDRFQDVMVPGNVHVLRDTDGWKLLSKKHIADLTVEVWTLGQEKPESVTTQLIQGRPRLLAAAPATAELGADLQEL